MKDIIIEEVIKKKSVAHGNSSKVLLPKRHEGKVVYALIVNPHVIKPRIRKETKVLKGEKYVKAEISTNAGTHSLWIEKKKVKQIFTD